MHLKEALRTIFRVVRQSVILSLLLYISFVIALLFFYLFYNWYLPKAKYEHNVDFQLQPVFNRISTGSFSSRQEYLSYYELVGYVNLFNSITETLSYGQEYSIQLLMDLPESDNNFDLGMFGVTAEIIDNLGRKSATLKTMGTLNYKSALLRYLSTLFYFPYYVFGRYEQKQFITLIIKDSFVDNAQLTTQNSYELLIKLNELKGIFYNELVRRSFGIHDKLQYYSVKLVIEAKFSGLKYCLANWFYFTTVILVISITCMIFLIFLLSIYDFKALLFGTKNPEELFKSESRLGLKALSYEKKDSTKLTGDISDDSFCDASFNSHSSEIKDSGLHSTIKKESDWSFFKSKKKN